MQAELVALLSVIRNDYVGVTQMKWRTLLSSTAGAVSVSSDASCGVKAC